MQCLVVPVLHQEEHRVNHSFYVHKHKHLYTHSLSSCSPHAYRANRERWGTAALFSTTCFSVKHRIPLSSTADKARTFLYHLQLVQLRIIFLPRTDARYVPFPHHSTKPYKILATGASRALRSYHFPNKRKTNDKEGQKPNLGCEALKQNKAKKNANFHVSKHAPAPGTSLSHSGTGCAF